MLILDVRIVLLAVDDEFAGEMQRPLYELHPDWIVGLVKSSCAIYKKPKLRGGAFVIRHSGCRFLIEMIRMKVVRSFLQSRRMCFPTKLAESHGVEILLSADVNGARTIDKLRYWRPDLIISTNFSHYIGKTVRESIASRGCWNLHKSLLPQYRGMAPSFHALLEGAPSCGATLHVVAKGIDCGDIISQVEVPIRKGDSVYKLNRKTSQAGGLLLAQTLREFESVGAQTHPQPPGSWKNYTYPTRKEVGTFLNKGLKFYCPGDFESLEDHNFNASGKRVHSSTPA